MGRERTDPRTEDPRSVVLGEDPDRFPNRCTPGGVLLGGPFVVSTCAHKDSRSPSPDGTKVNGSITNSRMTHGPGSGPFPCVVTCFIYV